MKTTVKRLSVALDKESLLMLDAMKIDMGMTYGGIIKQSILFMYLNKFFLESSPLARK